jgi:hypothetical protein
MLHLYCHLFQVQVCVDIKDITRQLNIDKYILYYRGEKQECKMTRQNNDSEG